MLPEGERQGRNGWALTHLPALPPATRVLLFGPGSPPLRSGETLHAPGGHASRFLVARGAVPRHPAALAISVCPPHSSVGCDHPLDPVYLPAALQLLDAPEHFRAQQVGRYPPANSSLGSRSETFLLLQPWPRAQPLLRASYPPFTTQQVRGAPGTPRLTGCGVRPGLPQPSFQRGKPRPIKALSCQTGTGSLASHLPTSYSPPPAALSTPLLLQVVPPRVAEPHQRPVPWDVRAVSVEVAVTPAEPHARVLFHLKGQDWPPGPGSLPCARLHATHPAGTAHRACRVQVSGWAPPRLALALCLPEGGPGVGERGLATPGPPDSNLLCWLSWDPAQGT